MLVINEHPENGRDRKNLKRFTLTQEDYGTAQVGKDEGPVRRITDYIFRKV